MEDGRLVFYSSLHAAQQNASREVEVAIVSNPNAITHTAESEQDMRAQWVLTRRSLPIALSNLFILLMRYTVSTHGSTAHSTEATQKELDAAKYSISKTIRNWANREQSLLLMKANIDKRVVALDNRRAQIAERMCNIRVPPLKDPRSKAEEQVYVNACKKLVALRKERVELLANVSRSELYNYTHDTHGLAMACLRFVAVLKRDLAQAQRELTALEPVVDGQGDNTSNAQRCAALKANFVSRVFQPTLDLLAARGLPTAEVNVAEAVYTDVPDADPYCLQRCDLIETVLESFVGTKMLAQRDHQAVALERALNDVKELKRKAKLIRSETAQVLAADGGGGGSQLRAVQQREEEVRRALLASEAEVDRLVGSASEVRPESETPETLLARVKEIKEACQSVKASVSAAASAPQAIKAMLEEHRQLQLRQLLKAAETNVRSANNIVASRFDVVDDETKSARTRADALETEIAVVNKARDSYEPHSFTHDDTALYALRNEQGLLDDMLHSLHAQRIDVATVHKAAEWINKEGLRMLGTTSVI